MRRSAPEGMLSPRTAFLATVTFVALVGPAGGATTPADGAPCQRAEEFHNVLGQGLSCRLGEMWLVLLEDGTRLLTHGPDPLPPAGPLEVALSGSRVPFCAAADEPHHEVVYARASDQADRYASLKSAIRSSVNQANGGLYAEGQLFGAHREFRFLCDTDGQVKVGNVRLAAPSPIVQFGTVVSGLKDQGFDEPHVKYWAYYDRTGLEVAVAAFAGQANLESDDRPVEWNANNFGGQYAVNYGYTGSYGAFVFLHEGGHALGAVQGSAPHTSGAGHCTDGQDVMCYADGGHHPYNGNVCNIQYFDCNHDDYFHPNPPTGNYLRTHWNIGSGITRFIHHPDVPPPPPPPPPPEPGNCDWTLNGGEVYWTSAAGLPYFSRDVAIPLGCPGHVFHLESTSPATADYDVCWLQHGIVLECFRNVGSETGVIPSWADTTRVNLREGTLGEFVLTAFGTAA